MAQLRGLRCVELKMQAESASSAVWKFKDNATAARAGSKIDSAVISNRPGS
jgi:hypothetical protein